MLGSSVEADAMSVKLVNNLIVENAKHVGI